MHINLCFLHSIKPPTTFTAYQHAFTYIEDCISCFPKLQATKNQHKHKTEHVLLKEIGQKRRYMTRIEMNKF